MATKTKQKKLSLAEHRPALKRRKYRHDELVAVDLFSGFGGLTQGIEEAGFSVIMAANHNPYKIEIHERNNPGAQHWRANLVDPDASDYHSAEDLPRADILVAGISCTNHSGANTRKAYKQGAALFELPDPDYESRVTKSERDRATANCVLAYARKHHPWMILIECTTELTSWGDALPGRSKVGDGSTYRWWHEQFDLLGYDHEVLYLNSMFFGVPQSRDRLYIVFWDRRIPAPDLEHRPVSWCGRCEKEVEARWTWKTGVPPTGQVRYGVQYEYRCPSCLRPVVPPFAPSLNALDLSDLGTRIGDRPIRKQRDGSMGRMAMSTLKRAEKCRQRFPDLPAVLMPAKAVHGVERHPWQPLSTQTSQQETAILSTGAIVVAAGNTYERPGSTCRSRSFTEPLWAQTATATAGLLTPPIAVAVDNYQGGPRGLNEALPTQGGSETMAIISSGVLPYRKNTLAAGPGEAMPTFTSEQIPGILTTAGTFAPGSLSEADLLIEWHAALREVPLEDCYLRMMKEHEIGRGCGFDVDFRGRKGTFIVWGSAKNQVDGFGNAVSPPVGEWIGRRLRVALHGRDGG